MPAVSRSTFYVPLPEEPDATAGDPIYATVDGFSSDEAVGPLGGDYATLDRGRPGRAPSNYDTFAPAPPSRQRQEPVYATVVPRSQRFNPAAGAPKQADVREPIYFELERTPPEPPAQHLKPGRRPPALELPIAIPAGMKSQFAALNGELAQRLAARRLN